MRFSCLRRTTPSGVFTSLLRAATGLAFLLALLVSTVPASRARAEEPASAPVPDPAPDTSGSATDFYMMSGESGMAYTFATIGDVQDGALEVVDALGNPLSFKFTGVSWGSWGESFANETTSFVANTATTCRGENILEELRVQDNGFESSVMITGLPEGATGLALGGFIGTTLAIEKTFPCDFDATEFTTDGEVYFKSDSGLRPFVLGTTTAVDANGVTIVCPVLFRQATGGYEFEIHVPTDWLATAVSPSSSIR